MDDRTGRLSVLTGGGRAALATAPPRVVLPPDWLPLVLVLGDALIAAGSVGAHPVGRLLRRAGLDALPQLLNVLKGDMSLVGPRAQSAWLDERGAREVPRYPILLLTALRWSPGS